MPTVPFLGSYGDISGSGLMFRNKLINGGFDIWQRGTSQTSSGYGSDDRWSNVHGGNSTKTASQQTFTVGQTDVPGNPKYFSRTVVTAGVANASNFVIKQQLIEGVATLSGQTCTISFWAKADTSRSVSIEFSQFFGTGGSPSAIVQNLGINKIAITSSWARYSATVTLPSISGKTLGTNGDDYLRLRIWLSAGSGSNASTDSLGEQSGTFDIANVQLEAGPQATPFEQRPIGTEFALCQRYYHVMSYDASQNSTNIFGSGCIDSATVGTVFLGQFPVRMRIAPAAALVGTFKVFGANGANSASDLSLNTAIQQNRTSPTQASLYISFSGGYVGGGMVLYSNTANSGITFSAEL
jgi:hypothetical protein